jgi:5-methylcytosine-specific restriction endonuclease McrA
MADYQTYLRSPEWKAKRARVLEFWDYKCVTCYSHLDLEVHHRTYARLGDELLTDLIVLCDRCHEKFHETIHREAGGPGPVTFKEIIEFFTGPQ